MTNTTRSFRTRRSVAVIVTAALAAGAVTGLATAASAADDHYSTDFSEFDPGDAPRDQDGWGGLPHYDFEIVEDGLRLSNATGSTGNMGQLYGPRLAAKAGESTTDATNDVFEMSFNIKSTTEDYQPGLNLSVAASGERSDGGSPQNRAGGLVNFTHLNDQMHVWTTWPAEGVTLDDWRNTGVTVDPASTHSIRYVVEFVEGDNNDIVSLWVDGQLVGEGVSSWENYHDSQEAQEKQSVQGPLFRANTSTPSEDGIGYGTYTPTDDERAALEGEGFLISDLAYGTYQSAPADPPAPTDEPAPATDGTSAYAEQSSNTSAMVSGSGFAPYENVAVTVFPGSHFVAWARADVNGNVHDGFVLPEELDAGMYTLQLEGENGAVAHADFEILGAPGGDEPAPGDPVAESIELGDATVTFDAELGDHPSGELVLSSSVSDDPSEFGDLPGDAQFAFGAYSFALNVAVGSSATVTIETDTPANTLFKSIGNEWSQYPASFEGTTISFELVDGGAGDADGVANGIIVDPVAPAVMATFTG